MNLSDSGDAFAKGVIAGIYHKLDGPVKYASAICTLVVQAVRTTIATMDAKELDLFIAAIELQL